MSETLLWEALSEENLERIKALVKSDPELIRSKDEEGDTPLHYAAFAGRLDLTAFLLENGADVNACDEDLLTPLHAAAMNGHVSVAERLLAANASVSAKDKSGRTPAELASAERYKKLAELLMKKQATPSSAKPSAASDAAHRPLFRFILIGLLAGFIAAVNFPNAGVFWNFLIWPLTLNAGFLLAMAAGSLIESFQEKPAESAGSNRGGTVVSLIFGIASLVAWYVPLFGFPVSLIGFFVGQNARQSKFRRLALAGATLSLAGLLATTANSYAGALEQAGYCESEHSCGSIIGGILAGKLLGGTGKIYSPSATE